MDDTATLDRRSLSLPDWKTALKKRIKRPKKPGFWELYCLFFCGFECGYAIMEFVNNRPVIGGYLAIVGGWWYYFYQSERKGQSFILNPLWWKGFLPTIIVGSIIVGVAG